MRFSTYGFCALSCFAAAPAMAQDTAPPPPVTVSGGVTVVTDYRFRGLTQTDEDAALQGTVNVNHESGFYVGTWASTLDDEVSLPGYGDTEVDLYGGYSTTLDNGIGIDVGMLYYWYVDAPGGNDTDYFEPYATVSYAIGPVSTSVGANYAWGGQDGLDYTASNDDSLYLHAEASTSIPGTPLSLNAHIGRSKGSLGLYNLDPNDDEYWDTSFGVEWAGGPITGGVKYVDTDISNAGDFAQANGRGATVLGYVGLSF
ncbi:TorF family putative porin [Stakelama saccharophila]|uniref:TorF family putative porin n=1 Tax=Stakelama saccharophila TaxID=3075605 RepID=A0ABZ0BA13_9SPHN|nr:TorF family putative porin [Stakelama sp. W311]WNO54245.1 TorF family putative porin [Stakelama sp. W311]